MIFLSHTHSDKPVVEPVAMRLREIYGECKVFYDSWSIQPGDGIIDKINDGLSKPKMVFFFVSEKSLNSNMVKLEWQNALYKATKGHCKIIPVRVDGCDMPPVLLQSLYIDMYAHGVEAAISQIVSVVQGDTTFTPQHLGFSNITYKMDGNPTKALTITICASHLMEPNPKFLILISNSKEEIKFALDGEVPYQGGFNENIKIGSGVTCNAMAIAPLGGAITPKHPLKIHVSSTGNQPVDVIGVMHLKTHEKYQPIPMNL